MTVLLAVSSTRHTALGTFRPGIVYALDPGPIENQRAIKSLTEGKDLQGKQISKDIVGRLLTEAEAEALMKQSHGKPEQVGTVSEEDPGSIDLDILEELRSQLRTAEGQMAEYKRGAQEAETASEKAAEAITDLKDSLAKEVGRAESAEAEAGVNLERAEAAETSLAGLRAEIAEAESSKPPVDEADTSKAPKAGANK